MVPMTAVVLLLWGQLAMLSLLWGTHNYNTIATPPMTVVILLFWQQLAMLSLLWGAHNNEARWCIS